VIAQYRRLGVVRCGMGLLVLVLGSTGLSGAARADLDEYVKKPDSAFAWSETSSVNTKAGVVTSIKLTSQVWQGITWNHDLRVYEPREIVHPDAMLLFITGGDTERKASDDDHKQAFGLAQVCGARVAVLPQVPNQPLLDGKTEDELIAETFVRYLQTKDDTWPLLFPMVKSAVKAMDAIQSWSRQNGKPVARFIVTGGSKRGWTTWLTGAVDDRVIGIAPMVIVMLNLGPQGPNQLKVWGQYSEQIHDYVERGLMETVATPTGTNLWKMVDPFTYRQRLVKPKLLINGANDRYWTLNALDLYWNELQGPKYLIELPNAGHDLKENREWATSGLGAFFHHVVLNRPMPQLTWDFAEGAGGDFHLTIRSNPAPRAARIWTARSENRDFRESKWEASSLKPGETMTYRGQTTSPGHLALFGEVEYQENGIPFHLTTTFQEPGLEKK
jgi:PhoPQ-activated pathogenicity-related protein